MNPFLIEFIKLVVITLVITTIIEITSLLLLRENKIKIIVTSIITNLVTNISLSIILQIVDSNNYYLYLIFFEVIIVIIEALIYFIMLKDIKRALKISLLCNIASYFFGEFLIPIFI